MNQVEEMNEYAVLALDVIHELQRIIDKQGEEIDQLRARESKTVDSVMKEFNELKPMVERAMREITALREQKEELSRDLAIANAALERRN